MSNNHSPRWTGSRFHPALCITSVLLMKRRARRHSDLSDDFLHVHDCHLLGHANESFQEPPAQPVLPRVQKKWRCKDLVVVKAGLLAPHTRISWSQRLLSSFSLFHLFSFIAPVRLRETGMAQWCERSRSTDVSRVRFPVRASYMCWVCC